MRATVEQQIEVTKEIHGASKSPRHSECAERALSALRAAGARQSMRQNQQWARLDRQATDLLARRDEAARRGNARAVDLTGRALQRVLASMRGLIDGASTARS